MIERDALTERAEYYRMNAGDIACADRVHADFAFLSLGVFAGSAVSDCFGEIPSCRPTNVLSQRKSTAAGGVFLKAVVLFDDFEMEIYRGEKIGIIGPNGVGKTTLLKMAMRQVEPDAGEVRLYENLNVGYYDQEQVDLNPDHQVIDELEPSRNADLEGTLRSFLA